MSKATEDVKPFLQEKYIDNPKMSSPHMSGAIRDLLTDLMFLCDEEGLDFDERVSSAGEVYIEERSMEMGVENDVDISEVMAYYDLSDNDWDSTPEATQRSMIAKFKED